MKLSQLKYFQAVCMFGSTTRAAEALYVSQPSISNAITSLEQEYNIQLFTRNGNRLVLTEEGRFMQEKAAAILSDISNLENSLYRFSNPDILYISIPPVVNSIIPQILNHFNRKHPELRIKIYEDLRKESLSLLRANERDMAITVIDDAAVDEFDVTPLIETSLYFYTHKDNPLAQRESISLTDLLSTPMVLFKNNYYQTALLEEQFSKSGISPSVVLYASQFSTIHSCLTAGQASSCMFGQWEAIPDVVIRPFNPPISVHLGILRKKDAPENKRLVSLSRYIQKEIAQYHDFV